MIFIQWILYDGDGRKKTRNIQNTKTKEKNSPFGCPPISPSIERRPTVFRHSETPKTSRTYARWDRGPSLVEQEIQGWARYEQMKAGNMIFIYVNF